MRKLDRFGIQPGMKAGDLISEKYKPDRPVTQVELDAFATSTEKWVCKCDCGSFFNVSAADLLSGKVTQCAKCSGDLAGQVEQASDTVERCAERREEAIDHVLHACIHTIGDALIELRETTEAHSNAIDVWYELNEKLEKQNAAPKIRSVK